MYGKANSYPSNRDLKSHISTKSRVSQSSKGETRLNYYVFTITIPNHDLVNHDLIASRRKIVFLSWKTKWNKNYKMKVLDNYLSVRYLNLSFTAFGNSRIVGDDDNGLAFVIERLEKCHNFGRGFGIQCTRRLIRKYK